VGRSRERASGRSEAEGPPFCERRERPTARARMPANLETSERP